MGLLDGKVALISGVARGQGRSHAVRLAEEGADIIGFDALQSYATLAYPMATEDDLYETVRLVEKTGRRIIGRQADVRDRTQVTGVVEEGLAELGHIDIVCGNAGISPPGMPFWQIPEEEWRDVIDVNLTGVWNTCAAAAPHMVERGAGGSIIVTSSGAGLKAMQNLADYNSSKFGVIGLTRTMANELAPHRIRVNAVCPSTVRTDMVLNDGLYRLFRPDLEHPTVDDVTPILSAMNPIPEPWLEPVDISNAIVWLASDYARFITGAVLPVDLGVSNKAM
jgi:(+)-trans-carveol dehydrogenase